MTVPPGPPAPGREGRLRVALLTREYPPEVYGGAGVHVTYLARELAGLVDVTVHCQGGERPGAVAHQPWDLLAGANQALATISADLSMTAAVGGAGLVHSHTWYANLAGHLASMLYGIPARDDGAFAGAAAAVEGGAARRRVRPVQLVRAGIGRGRGRGHRGVRRDAGGRAGRLPRG